MNKMDLNGHGKLNGVVLVVRDYGGAAVLLHARLKHDDYILRTLRAPFDFVFGAPFHEEMHDSRKARVIEERTFVDALGEGNLRGVVLVLRVVRQVPIGPHEIRQQSERVNVTHLIVPVLTQQLRGGPSHRTHHPVMGTAENDKAVWLWCVVMVGRT